MDLGSDGSIETASSGLDSHTLCFGFDLAIGSLLLLVNGRMLARHKPDERGDSAARRTGLQVATAAALFDILHGLGHLELHQKGPAGMTHSATDDLGGALAAFLGAVGFLAMAPLIGWLFGVPGRACLVLHLVQCAAFIQVPVQFAFGAVQLVINLWYCVPRLLWIGTDTKDAISHRVDGGWATASVGNLLLMPVVFSEMLACDLFYRGFGGHFLYDLSILLISIALTWDVSRAAQPAEDASPIKQS